MITECLENNLLVLLGKEGKITTSWILLANKMSDFLLIEWIYKCVHFAISWKKWSSSFKAISAPVFFSHNNDPFSSCRLKSHFEENPRDLGMIHEPYANSCVSKVTCLTSLCCLCFFSDLLKHDKLLSNKEIPAHLRDVPDYLIDPKTKEASNVVKLSRAAMGIDKPQRRKRQGFKGGSGKSRDPLRTFSAEVHLPI